jgi:hypothetical protein
MYVVPPKKRESLSLVLPPPKARARFVGRLRNGGGVHRDQRRHNDRAAVKVRLRRGED